MVAYAGKDSDEASVDDARGIAHADRRDAARSTSRATRCRPTWSRPSAGSPSRPPRRRASPRPRCPEDHRGSGQRVLQGLRPARAGVGAGPEEVGPAGADRDRADGQEVRPLRGRPGLSAGHSRRVPGRWKSRGVARRRARRSPSGRLRSPVPPCGLRVPGYGWRGPDGCAAAAGMAHWYPPSRVRTITRSAMSWQCVPDV